MSSQTTHTPDEDQVSIDSSDSSDSLDSSESDTESDTNAESSKDTANLPKRTPSPLTWFFFFAGGSLSIILDQWSKAWAAKALYVGSAAISVGGVPLDPRHIRTKTIEVTSWFDYRLAGNKGAAWGIFNDFSDTIRVPFFVILSAVALTFLLIVFYNSAGQRLMQAALTLIAGGAVGNLIDRIQIGYVIDFIDWHIGKHHWPIFNIADVCISVGVGLMVIDMFRQIAKERALLREQGQAAASAGESDGTSSD